MGNLKIKILFLFFSFALLQGCSSASKDSSVSRIGDGSKTESLDKNQNKISSEEVALLKEAEDDYASELFTSARKNFEKFKESFPASNSTNMAILKIADCRFYAEEYPEAVTAYEDFLNTFPSSQASPYALFQIAESWRLQSKGTARDQSPLKKALNTFEEVVKRYPETSSAKKAKFAINSINEEFAEYYKNVGEFYSKIGKDKASEARLKESKSYIKKESVEDLTVKDEVRAESETIVEPAKIEELETDKAIEVANNNHGFFDLFWGDSVPEKEEIQKLGSIPEITTSSELLAVKKSDVDTKISSQAPHSEPLEESETKSRSISEMIFGIFSPSEVEPKIKNKLIVSCKNISGKKALIFSTDESKLNFKMDQGRIIFLDVSNYIKENCSEVVDLKNIGKDYVYNYKAGGLTFFQPEKSRIIAVFRR